MTAKPRSRKTTPRTASNGANLEELGLSHLFVSGSTSRRVAEALLTGQRHSRVDLSEQFGIARSSISRVVGALQKGGVQIERTEGNDHGHPATYRVVGLPRQTGIPKGAVEFKSITPEPTTVKLERMEEFDAEGGTVVLTSDLGTVKGRAPLHPLLASLSGGLPLQRIVLLPGGGQHWVLGQAETITITDVEYVR